LLVSSLTCCSWAVSAWALDNIPDHANAAAAATVANVRRENCAGRLIVDIFSSPVTFRLGGPKARPGKT
jgi:hypothetical protein